MTQLITILAQVPTPGILEALGKILQNQWWAAVLLGIFIFMHFMRGAAIEKRLSGILEENVKASAAEAKANLDQAVALKEIAQRLEALERTVYRTHQTKEGENESDTN